MKLSNREKKGLGVLLVLSILANVTQYALTTSEIPIWPSELNYRYSDVFQGGALLYRPEGTNGMAMLDLSDAIVRVTEFGAPLQCAVMRIYTNTGQTIESNCIPGDVE